jgi:predicted regulator of amino acid metabolism with ACT domain
MTKLTVKNRIVDVAVMNDPSIPPALGRFSTEVDYRRGDSFRVVTGVERVKVVIDEKNLEKLTAVLPKGNIIEVVRNLAEIIVSTTEELERTPGVVAAIATELAVNNINNIELMTCNPQMVIVVEEKDAMKSYESLQKLMSASQRPHSPERLAKP